MNNDRNTLRAVGVFLALWVVAELVVAVTLRVDGYDGYWYLSNSWYMAGGPVHHYENTKAPLLSLFYLPLFWLRAAGAPELVAFIGAHLLSAALTFTTGCVVARALAASFSRPVAWAGAFAFLGCRTVFRYAAFSMSDIPTTLFILLALETVRRRHDHDGWRARGPFVLAVLLAVLSRYPSGLVWAIAVGWDAAVLLRERRDGRAVFRRLTQHAVGLAVLLAGVFVVHLIIYLGPHGGPVAAARAFADMVTHNMLLGGVSSHTGEPWWEYIPMLAAACTTPMLVLMVIGAAATVWRGRRTEALHGAWVIAHLLFIFFVSSHKEIRYLLPALPSLFFFALWGLRGLRTVALRAGRVVSPSALQPWAIAALLAVGSLSAAREARMLAQPFFRTPLPRQLAAWVDSTVAPAGHIFWTGNHYPLHPEHYVFSARDEYYYLFHLGPHVFEYYMERPVVDTRPLPAVLAADVPYPTRMALALQDGDALLSSIPNVTWTSTLPIPLRPLILSEVEAWDLLRDPAPSSGPFSFNAPGAPLTARVTTDATPALVLQGLPGPTEVVIRRRPAPPISLGLIDPSSGSARLALPPDLDAATIQALRVVHYRPRPVPLT